MTADKPDNLQQMPRRRAVKILLWIVVPVILASAAGVAGFHGTRNGVPALAAIIVGFVLAVIGGGVSRMRHGVGAPFGLEEIERHAKLRLNPIEGLMVFYGVVIVLATAGGIGISALAAELAGSSKTSTPYTGTWGATRNGVRIALQVPKAEVAQGEKVSLSAVVHNTSRQPVVLVGNPYVTINISVNGKPEGDLIGNGELPEEAVALSPGEQKVYSVESFDTSRWSGECGFSGGINVFGDTKPSVPVGELMVRVK